MPPIEFGPIEYLAGVWVISAVLLILGALAYQSNVRVGGPVAWIIYVIFGSAGGFLALPLTMVMNLEGYLFILLLVAFAFSIPVIHWIMPTIAQDFQTSGFTSSLVLAFLVGLAVAISAFVILDWRGVVPTELLGNFDPFPTE